MITKGAALVFAEQWIESLNSRDLTKILSHCTDDFEMATPFIISIMNEPSGTLKGKDKVAAYWTTGLNRFPGLQFKLFDVLYGVNSITIYYQSVLNKKATGFFLLNPEGKVTKSIAHYD